MAVYFRLRLTAWRITNKIMQLQFYLVIYVGWLAQSIIQLAWLNIRKHSGDCLKLYCPAVLDGNWMARTVLDGDVLNPSHSCITLSLLLIPRAEPFPGKHRGRTLLPRGQTILLQLYMNVLGILCLDSNEHKG